MDYFKVISIAFFGIFQNVVFYGQIVLNIVILLLTIFYLLLKIRKIKNEK